MSEAFAKSCNTYFINLAEKVGAESIFDFAQKAGLSADVVITEGLTANKPRTAFENKRIPAALANFAIARGILRCRRCRCRFSNAVANGGVYSSFLVSGFKDKDGKTEYQKGTEGRRIMSKETAVTLSNMMTRVFEDGTAAASRPKSGLYGGKTATAETGWKTADGSAGKTLGLRGLRVRRRKAFGGRARRGRRIGRSRRRSRVQIALRRAVGGIGRLRAAICKIGILPFAVLAIPPIPPPMLPMSGDIYAVGRHKI